MISLMWTCAIFSVAVSAQPDIVFPSMVESVQPNQESPQELTPSPKTAKKCVPLTECPILFKLWESNPKGVDEFSCGFSDDSRKQQVFECPDVLHHTVLETPGSNECVCKSLSSCPELDSLARNRQFQELDKHMRCGWDATTGGRLPLYCCPDRMTSPQPPSPKKVLSGQSNATVEILNATTSVRINAENADDGAKEESEEVDGDCGLLTSLKIFGGSDAGDHEFPWAAALVYVDAKNASSRLYLCGGSLISTSYVVTAAHCVDSRGAHQLAQVRLGHASLASNDSVDVDIESVTLHPDFEQDPILKNDIALLKLARPVEKTEATWPICLDRADQDVVEPTVIGWGLINQDNSSSVLQKLELNITSGKECQAIYEKRIPGFVIESSQVCAAGTDGKDSCKGDSGGPLLFLDKKGRSRIVGITSFGTVKCDSSVPGVYTRVSSYRNWIKSVVKKVQK